MSLSTQVRDNVHGFIRWDGDEFLRVVDSPAFQRLRGIRQLAFAHYVYPGATHTRFNHSLGVFHLATRLCDQLDVKGDDRRLVRLAALLHDVGHLPFSHASEPVLEQFCHQEFRAGRGAKGHERITRDVILRGWGLDNAVEEQTRQQVVQLLEKEPEESILRQIVSGPLDADKMDYLLRDSLNCGVRYGIYDPDQLIRSLCRGTWPGTSEAVMMVRRDGVRSVEQFVLAKSYMTAQVYHHKVRLATDGMLLRALTSGIESDGIDELRTLFSYDGSEGFVRELLQWDDERVMRAFTDERYKGKVVHDMLWRLRRRDLLKQVYTRQVKDRNFGDKVLAAILKKGSSDPKFRELERRVADKFGYRPHEVIVTVDSIGNVREAASKEGGIMVESLGGEPPCPLDQASQLFEAIDATYKEVYLDCFVPATYSSDAEKVRYVDNFKTFFEDTLAEVLCSSERGEPQ